MYIRICILIIMVINVFELKTQTHNPKKWYLGYQATNRDTNTLDTGYFKFWGLTTIDFKYNPIYKNKLGNALSISACNSFIYDSIDSLVLYSNGSKIFNYKHRLIQGSDSLNYSEIIWSNSPFAGDYFGEYYISIFPQAIQILPSVKNKNQYYMISVYITGDTNNFYKLVYSIVDMSLNNGLGKMIVKEKPIAYGDFTEAITATKHANGKDWWIVAREYTGTCYTVMLLDTSGIKVVNTNQCIGFDLKDRDAGKRNFVNKFSWNGKMYASISFKGVELYDFDRCTGRLFNRREYIIPKNDSFMNYSVCFTRDDKLLYFNSTGKIYQLEITSNIVQKVADYKLFYDTSTNDGGVLPVPSTFGYTQLGFDNKIYICSPSSSRHLSTIENPDIVGIGCNVKQMSEKLLTWNVGLPVFPNYELGAMVCCHGTTLNTDLARTDSTMVVQNLASGYQWINCDSGFKAVLNANSQVFKPSYTANYAAVLFDKDGCTDTSNCYLFEVNRSGIEDIDNKRFSIYPNPAKDRITIEFSHDFKLREKVELYDVFGRRLEAAVVKREKNSSTFDVSNLSIGLYLLKIDTNSYKIQIER